MLYPSYSDLMNVVNSEVPEGEKPIVNSRYSIVIATAKRARQIIANADSTVDKYETKKPLSVAVEEIMNGSVKVISGGADIEDDEEKIKHASEVYDVLEGDEDIYDEEDIFDEEEIEEEDEIDESSEEDDYE